MYSAATAQKYELVVATIKQHNNRVFDGDANTNYASKALSLFNEVWTHILGDRNGSSTFFEEYRSINTWPMVAKIQIPESDGTKFAYLFSFHLEGKLYKRHGNTQTKSNKTDGTFYKTKFVCPCCQQHGFWLIKPRSAFPEVDLGTAKPLPIKGNDVITPKLKYAYIKVIDNKHHSESCRDSCILTPRSPGFAHLITESSVMRAYVASNPNISIAAFKTKVHATFVIEGSFKVNFYQNQLHMMKQTIIMNQFKGVHEIFPHLLTAMIAHTPSMTIALEVQCAPSPTSCYFKRFFLALPNVKEIVGTATLSIIGTDAAFSKTLQYQGLFGFLVTKDGNGVNLPFAIFHFPVENCQNWAWVFQMLIRTGINLDNIVIFVDRGHQRAAVKAIYFYLKIRLHLRFCTEHIIRNVNEKFKISKGLHKSVRNVINSIQASHNLVDYSNHVRTLAVLLDTNEVSVYILSIHPTDWTVYGNAPDFDENAHMCRVLQDFELDLTSAFNDGLPPRKPLPLFRIARNNLTEGENYVALSSGIRTNLPPVAVIAFILRSNDLLQRSRIVANNLAMPTTVICMRTFLDANKRVHAVSNAHIVVTRMDNTNDDGSVITFSVNTKVKNYIVLFLDNHSFECSCMDRKMLFGGCLHMILVTRSPLFQWPKNVSLVDLLVNSSISAYHAQVYKTAFMGYTMNISIPPATAVNAAFDNSQLFQLPVLLGMPIFKDLETDTRRIASSGDMTGRGKTRSPTKLTGSKRGTTRHVNGSEMVSKPFQKIESISQAFNTAVSEGYFERDSSEIAPDNNVQTLEREMCSQSRAYSCGFCKLTKTGHSSSTCPHFSRSFACYEPTFTKNIGHGQYLLYSVRQSLLNQMIPHELIALSQSSKRLDMQPLVYDHTDSANFPYNEDDVEVASSNDEDKKMPAKQEPIVGGLEDTSDEEDTKMPAKPEPLSGLHMKDKSTESNLDPFVNTSDEDTKILGTQEQVFDNHKKDTTEIKWDELLNEEDTKMPATPEQVFDNHKKDTTEFKWDELLNTSDDENTMQQLRIGEIYTFVEQQTTKVRKKVITKVHQDCRIIQTEKDRILIYAIDKPEIVVEKQATRSIGVLLNWFVIVNGVQKHMSECEMQAAKDSEFYAEQKKIKALTLQDIDDDLFDGDSKYARFVDSAMKSQTKMRRDRKRRVEALGLDLEIAVECSTYMIRMPWSISEGCVYISNTCPLDAVNFVFFNLKWVMSCDGIRDMADKKSLYYRALALAKAKKFNESRVLQYIEGMYKFVSMENPNIFLEGLKKAWNNPKHGECSLNAFGRVNGMQKVLLPYSTSFTYVNVSNCVRCKKVSVSKEITSNMIEMSTVVPAVTSVCEQLNAWFSWREMRGKKCSHCQTQGILKRMHLVKLPSPLLCIAGSDYAAHSTKLLTVLKPDYAHANMIFGNTQLCLRGVVATNTNSHFIGLIHHKNHAWTGHDGLSVEWTNYKLGRDEKQLKKYNIAMFVYEVCPIIDILADNELKRWIDNRVVGCISIEHNSEEQAGIGKVYTESRQQGKQVTVEIDK